MDQGRFCRCFRIESIGTISSACDNKIDAMIYTVGHPSGSIKEATTSCDSVLVEVSGAAIEKLVNDNDYYRQAVIPGGMYRGNPNDTKTFGVGATFVSSSDVPEKVVYVVVKAVFETLTLSANCIRLLAICKRRK